MNDELNGFSPAAPALEFAPRPRPPQHQHLLPDEESAGAGMGTGAAGGGNRFEPYKRLHKLLRGRYRLLLPLMAAAAAAGAALGFQTHHVLYRSEGLIHVANSLPQVMERTDQNEPLQMFEEFVQSQLLLMTSRHVVALALASPDFKAAAGPSAPGIDAFVTALAVEHPPRTQAIRVTYTCDDPRLAAHAVKAVIDAYASTYGDSDNQGDAKRLQILSERKLALAAQLRDMAGQMSAGAQLPSATSIAMIDELMREYLKQESLVETELQNYQVAGFGANRPPVVAARQRLAGLRQKIESYRKDFLAMQVAAAATPARNRPIQLLPQFQAYEEQMDEVRKELDETNRRIDVLRTEASLGAARLNVLSEGDLPVAPYSDRRAAFALIDGVGAAGLPVLLFLALGVLDRRYRCSDDAQDLPSSLPLLGVVPELPERLLYPDLARVAAHCVHNLRIRLQLLGRAADQRVFTITSATAGEGKTSLTLALGLSFAASGKRTLLIDCDLVGRGLTHRLKSDGERGLMESLDGEGLNLVREVARNLSLLPAGRADGFVANGLSPDALRELVDAACDRYDLILIDTGPVLASLEAPVVAQVADQVILTIVQGQQQPSVQRALRLLNLIGARVAGFVFNRASASDYHRSVGGMAYGYGSSRPSSRSAGSVVGRSETGTRDAANGMNAAVGAGPGAGANAGAATADHDAPYGPLARSVAYFMPASKNGKN